MSVSLPCQKDVITSIGEPPNMPFPHCFHFLVPLSYSSLPTSGLLWLHHLHFSWLSQTHSLFYKWFTLVVGMIIYFRLWRLLHLRSHLLLRNQSLLILLFSLAISRPLCKIEFYFSIGGLTLSFLSTNDWSPWQQRNGGSRSLSFKEWITSKTRAWLYLLKS